MKQNVYLFKDTSQLSHHWALQIVPILKSVIGLPASVVDLGGGLGAWCLAFKKAGTLKVRCIDHPSIREVDLLVQPSEFVRWDLDFGMPQPERFELALSLEFAEHVSSRWNLDIVQFLTASSDVIVFSAAIPRQPGRGHINTRSRSYWRELFQKRGFKRYDVIRPQILFDESIPRWFRQNLFIFANERGSMRLLLPKQKFLPEGFEIIDENILDCPPNLLELLSHLPDALKRAVFFRIKNASIKRP